MNRCRVPSPCGRLRARWTLQGTSRPNRTGRAETAACRHGRRATGSVVNPIRGDGKPLLGLLPRLAAPALLITGGYDPLTSPGQRDAFRRASPDHRLLEVAGAGHFVHADEPLQYASAVSEFVLACAGDLSGTGTGRVPATGS
jgi:pimeloyl-ACP methyl ester carboxylesterase